MEKTRLGRTDLMVTRTAFGALPVQRRSMEEGAALLRKAYESGINFFDTARVYTDSEEKIGLGLSDVRDKIIIATKTGGWNRERVLADLEISLKNMKTDYVDILQLHNPPELPDPNDPESSYAGMLEAKKAGTIRHIGITNHRLHIAKQAIESGLFETLQYPLSVLSNDDELAVAESCRAADVGFIAMKALSGGLVSNIPAAFAFLRQYDNVVPIWGIQHESELEEFLALEADPPALDDEMRKSIAADRAELGNNFCRGCGYCLPCPAEIIIPVAAQMRYMLRRAPSRLFLTDEWRERMERIEDCTECRQCVEKCPYGLDVPKQLKEMLEDYRQFSAEYER